MIKNLGINVTHVTFRDGGSWIAVTDNDYNRDATVHAIKFEDGSIWSLRTGWCDIEKAKPSSAIGDMIENMEKRLAKLEAKEERRDHTVTVGLPALLKVGHEITITKLGEGICSVRG